MGYSIAEGIGRDTVKSLLLAENVLGHGTLLPQTARGEFPIAHAFGNRVLPLPNSPWLGRNDIAAICGLVRTAASNVEEVLDRMEAIA